MLTLNAFFPLVVIAVVIVGIWAFNKYLEDRYAHGLIQWQPIWIIAVTLAIAFIVWVKVDYVHYGEDRAKEGHLTETSDYVIFDDPTGDLNKIHILTPAIDWTKEAGYKLKESEAPAWIQENHRLAKIRAQQLSVEDQGMRPIVLSLTFVIGLLWLYIYNIRGLEGNFILAIPVTIFHVIFSLFILACLVLFAAGVAGEVGQVARDRRLEREYHEKVAKFFDRHMGSRF